MSASPSSAPRRRAGVAAVIPPVAVLIAALVAAVTFAPPCRAQDDFVRGDVNGDGKVDIGDVGFFLRAAMRDVVLPCFDAADVNDDGHVCFDFSLSGGPCAQPVPDFNTLLGYLFSLRPLVGLTVLPAPFPLAGPDPTADDLPCESGSSDGRIAGGEDYRFDWETPPFLLPGFQSEEIFLRISTADAIDGFSLAYIVDTRFIEITSVDLADTAFPQSRRQGLEDSRLFLWFLHDLPQNTLKLLHVTALFADDSVFPPEFIPFAATKGPVDATRILRIVANVKPDAPTGPGRVQLMVPYLDLLGDPIFDIAGLRNQFIVGGQTVEVEPELQSTSMAVVINEPPELFTFIRGDANSDRRLDISDATFTLSFLFGGGPKPYLIDSADANDDGTVNISDASYTLGHLFLGTRGPLPPYPFCGLDPTPDDLPVDILDGRVLASCP